MSTAAVNVSDKLNDEKCPGKFHIYLAFVILTIQLLITILYIDPFGIFSTTNEESVEKNKIVTWVYGGIALVSTVLYGYRYWYSKKE